MANIYTHLGKSLADFDQMIKRFGVVTVMNAKVWNASDVEALIGESKHFSDSNAYNVLKILEANAASALCTLDTLKIANVTQEGPTKTVNGGQYSNPLIKFGKSARLEMQDALGNAEAIEALCGGVVEYKVDGAKETIVGLHVGEDFTGPKTILGDSFFIDQKTGAQVPVKIIFYQFLPDSLFNLTQDAEGDATVFDMNGDLLTTVIQVGVKEDGNPVTYKDLKHGVFYSILDPDTIGATGSSEPDLSALNEAN